MSIKVIARKKLGFRNPAPAGKTDEIVIVEPYKFSTVPDWVEKDPLFAWAKKDGSIVVDDKVQAAAPKKETAAKREKAAAEEKKG